MNPTNASRPPFPPYTRETAIQKVRMAEDGFGRHLLRGTDQRHACNRT